MKSEQQKHISLLDNGRFYVLAVTVLVSLVCFFGFQFIYPDTRLREIRLQQTFGLLAVLYWYLLLVVSSVSKLVTPKPWLDFVLYLRKPIGVGVAYFAVLHFILGFFQQLGGWQGVWLLSVALRVAVLFGAITLLVLLVMALLSVDRIARLIRFRSWKALGVISKLTGLLIIVHVWMIGTHMSSRLLQLVGFQALLVLFGLESMKLVKSLQAKRKHTTAPWVIGAAVWLVLSGGLIAMHSYVPSYSKTHQDHITDPKAATHGH